MTTFINYLWSLNVNFIIGVLTCIVFTLKKINNHFGLLEIFNFSMSLYYRQAREYGNCIQENVFDVEHCHYEQKEAGHYLTVALSTDIADHKCPGICNPMWPLFLKCYCFPCIRIRYIILYLDIKDFSFHSADVLQSNPVLGDSYLMCMARCVF